MKARVLACLLAAAGALRADEPPAALVPEYEISVADAGALKRVFVENAWMTTFSGSNLYRGTLVRLGPVLYAVGQKGRDAWNGRLLDFLVTRLLEKRPARLAYMGSPGLVSPFGLTLPDLTPAQREAARLLLSGVRSGSDVPTTLRAQDGSDATVNVTPVALKLQKLAAVLDGPCLTLSRDPLVAASLSRRCAETHGPSLPPGTAALLDVDAAQLFPAGSVVMEKLLGLEGSLRVAFDFDAKAARYVPSRAEMPLSRGHLVREGALDERLLAALPSGTLAFTTLALPDPGKLDVETVETYLRSAREKPPASVLTVTLAFLGMRSTGSLDPESLTAVLLPRTAGGETGLESLFGRATRRPVGVSTACAGFVALSPSTTALQSIEAACSGKEPSMKQAPPEILSRLSKGPASGSLYLNVGRFLGSSLELGWQRGGGRRAPDLPPEVSQALELLDQLPAYAFSGRVEGDVLRMPAASHSPTARAPKAGGRKS